MKIVASLENCSTSTEIPSVKCTWIPKKVLNNNQKSFKQTKIFFKVVLVNQKRKLFQIYIDINILLNKSIYFHVLADDWYMPIVKMINCKNVTYIVD